MKINIKISSSSMTMTAIYLASFILTVISIGLMSIHFIHNKEQVSLYQHKVENLIDMSRDINIISLHVEDLSKKTNQENIEARLIKQSCLTNMEVMNEMDNIVSIFNQKGFSVSYNMGQSKPTVINKIMNLDVMLIIKPLKNLINPLNNVNQAVAAITSKGKYKSVSSVSIHAQGKFEKIMIGMSLWVSADLAL